MVRPPRLLSDRPPRWSFRDYAWGLSSKLGVLCLILVTVFTVLRLINSRHLGLFSWKLEHFLHQLPSFSAARWESWILFLFASIAIVMLWLTARRRQRRPALRVLHPQALDWEPGSGPPLIARDGLRTHVLKRCAEVPLVFLTGQSGAGKSILAKDLVDRLTESSGGRGPRWIPVYVDAADATETWDGGLERTLMEACVNARRELLQSAPSQTPAAALRGANSIELLRDLVLRLRPERGDERSAVRVLLVIDQIDDYMSRFKDAFWERGADPTTGSILLTAKALEAKNYAWRQIASLLQDGLEQAPCHVLIIYRNDSFVIDVSCFEFGKTRASRILVSALNADAVEKALLPMLARAVCGENSNTDIRSDPFIKRFVHDLRSNKQILPVRIPHIMAGINQLCELSESAYARAGGLQGLEAMALRQRVQDCVKAAAGTLGGSRLSEEESLSLLDTLADEQHQPLPLMSSQICAELKRRWGFADTNQDFYEQRIGLLLRIYSDVQFVRELRHMDILGGETARYKLHHDYLIYGVRHLLKTEYPGFLTLSKKFNAKDPGQLEWFGIFLKHWSFDWFRLIRYGFYRTSPPSNFKRFAGRIVIISALKLCAILLIVSTIVSKITFRWTVDEYVQSGTAQLNRLASESRSVHTEYVQRLNKEHNTLWSWPKGLVAVSGFDPERRLNLYKNALSASACSDVLNSWDSASHLASEQRTQRCKELAYLLSMPIAAMDAEKQEWQPIKAPEQREWHGYRRDFQCLWWERMGEDGVALERRLDEAAAKDLLQWERGLTQQQAAELWAAAISPRGPEYSYLNKCQPRLRLAFYALLNDRAGAVDAATARAGLWKMLKDLSVPVSTQSLDMEERTLLQSRLEKLRRELLEKLGAKLSAMQVQSFFDEALDRSQKSDRWLRFQGIDLPAQAASAEAVPLLLQRLAPDRAQETARRLYLDGAGYSDAVPVTQEFFAALIEVMTPRLRGLLAQELLERLPTATKPGGPFQNWKTGAFVAIKHMPRELAWSMVEALFTRLEGHLPPGKPRQLPQPAYAALCSLLSASATQLLPEHRRAFLQRWWRLYRRLAERSVSDLEVGGDPSILSTLSDVLAHGATLPEPPSPAPTTSASRNPEPAQRVLDPTWPWLEVVSPTDLNRTLEHLQAQLAANRLLAPWSYFGSSLPSDLLPFLPADQQLSFFQRQVSGKDALVQGSPSGWGRVGWNGMIRTLCSTEAGQRSLKDLLIDSYAAAPQRGLQELNRLLFLMPLHQLCPDAEPIAHQIVSAFAAWSEQIDSASVVVPPVTRDALRTLVGLLANARLDGREWRERFYSLHKKRIDSSIAAQRRESIGQPAANLDASLRNSPDWTPLWMELKGDSPRAFSNFVDEKLPSEDQAKSLSEDQRLALQAVIIRILPVVDEETTPKRHLFCQSFIDDTKWGQELRQLCIPHLNADSRDAALTAVYCQYLGRLCSADDIRRRGELPGISAKDVLRLVPLGPDERPQPGGPWMQRWIDLLRAPSVNESVRQAVLARISRVLERHGHGTLDMTGSLDPWQFIPWARARGFDVEARLE